ncbi:MAG TPA: MmcQ/YjbR family DNA-binding protein [Thermoleophilaceae bacterium]
MAVTADDVRACLDGLPRSYEVFVRGRWKFRVGQIVYIAFSKDETLMGFAFPKEERQMLVETWPGKFIYPRESDMRFSWVVARLDQLSQSEMEEYVFDAWRMVVPKQVAAAELLRRGELPDGDRQEHQA